MANIRNNEAFKQLYASIKKRLEEGVNPRTDKALEGDIQEAMANIILSIELGKDDEAFCGMFLPRLNREYNYSYPAAAAITIINATPTIIFNPIILFQMCEGYTDVSTIIQHEIYHLIFKHLLESRRYPDHKRCNVAMDTSVNQYITFSDNLAKQCYTLKNFNQEMQCNAEEKREFEYYYNLIPEKHFQNQGMNMLKQLLDRLKDLQDEKSKRENGEGGSGSGDSNSEGESEDSNENDESNSNSGKGESKKEGEPNEKEGSGSGEGDSEEKDEQSSGSGDSKESEEVSENKSSSSKKPSDMTDKEIDDEIKDIIEAIKKMIQNGKISNDITESVEGSSNELTAAEKLTLEDLVKGTLESAKQRGKIPGNISGMIEDLYFKDPIISWKKEFRNMIGSIPCPYKTTMRVKNRRQPQRADISGRVYDRKVKICIAIDTSGSVDDNQLMYFFNEIFHLTKDYNTIITLIQCDANISSVTTLKDKKDVKKIKVTGRGGTSFTPVFEYLKNDVKKLDQPDLLIYFTDGYGEGEIDVNLRGRYDLMWVISGLKDELSVRTPSFINKVRYLNIEGKQYR